MYDVEANHTHTSYVAKQVCTHMWTKIRTCLFSRPDNNKCSATSNFNRSQRWNNSTWHLFSMWQCGTTFSRDGYAKSCEVQVPFLKLPKYKVQLILLVEE